MSGDDPGTCAGRVGPEAALDTEKIAAACDALLDAFGARRIFECRALETRSEQSAACWPAPSAECVLTYVVVPVVALWALYLLLYEVLLLKALPFLIERWYKSDGNAHNRLRDPKHLLPFVTSLLFIVFIPIELYHFCAGLGDVVFEWRATAVRPNLFALTFGALKGAIDEPGEIVTKILELYGLKSLVNDIRKAQCEALGLGWRTDRGFSEQVSISLNIVDERGFFGMRTISDVSLTKLFPNGYACSIVKEAAKHADTEDGPTIAVGGGARRRHPFLKVEPCRAQFGRDGPTEADTIHRQLTDQLKNCLSSCFGPGNIVEDLACEQRVTEAYVCALTHEKWGRASRRSVQPEDAHHNITSEKAAHLEKIANEKYRVYLIRKSVLRDLKDKHERGQIDYSRAGSVPYGKHRVKMLLLLRQLYFFGEDDEEADEDKAPSEPELERVVTVSRPAVAGPATAAPRVKEIEVDGVEKYRDDRGACIEFASGQQDEVDADDVDELPRPPLLRRSSSLFGSSRRFVPDRRVKLKRTHVQHERLVVSEVYITTHVAPTEGKIADAVSRRPPPPPTATPCRRPPSEPPGCLARSPISESRGL